MSDYPAYYLHRISYEHHVARPLLEAGWVSIGYGSAAEVFFPDGATSPAQIDYPEFERRLHELYGFQMRSRRNLYRFVYEMEKNDTLVVPEPGAFRLYTVEGFAVPRAAWSPEVQAIVRAAGGEDADLGFLRKVRPQISHPIGKQYVEDQSLRARLNYRGASVDMSDLSGEIERALKNSETGSSFELSDKLTSGLQQAALDALRQYTSPDELERLVAAYFLAAGADDATVQSKRARHGTAEKAGDADVIAVFGDLRLAFFVQVKLHKGGSSDWGIQQIQTFAEAQRGLGAQSDYADYTKALWLITLGEGVASDESSSSDEVQVINGEEFARMLVNVGMSRVFGGRVD